jgi:hypothetical protein
MMECVLTSSEVDLGLQHSLEYELMNHYTTNDLPLEVNTLTITPPMIYHTRGEHTNHYTTSPRVW